MEMKFIEKWGNTEDEAIELALSELKLSKEEVTIEILEESSRGFLGFGKKLAKVRVSKKDNSKKAAKSVKIEENIQKSKEKIDEIEKSKFAASKPADSEEIAVATTIKKFTEPEETAALDFIKNVIEKMGLNVEVSAKEDESGKIYIDIDGKDAAAVIGKRGQTLDALQYLTRVVVNRDEESYIKIVVDAGNYRVKRISTLTNLAKRLADKAIKTRKPVKLEPMSPYERKIIHSALHHNKKVTTKSEGKEPYRRIVIQIV